MNVHALAVAHAFLSGPWEPDAMARRAARVLGDRRRARWHTLALVVIHAYPEPPHDAPRALAEPVLATDIGSKLLRPDLEGGRPPRLAHLATEPTRMGPTRWPVAPLDTVRDLGEHLGLTPARLAWFADVRSLETSADDERLRHYGYRWVPTRTGGVRLLEAPKRQLRHIQRVVLRTILDHVPPHDAACGFRPGGSVHRFVAPHVGQAVVLRFDLRAFFASATAGRIYGLWRTAGYPEPVAHVLTGLTTNAAPPAVLQLLSTGADRSAARSMRTHLAHPHLPQGAPTSPALANLVAHGLDRRLTGLAARLGARSTRYADDLAFSGPPSLGRRAPAMIRLVDAIVRDEGFTLNAAKTTWAGPGQRHRLGGLVINTTPNVDRRDYDRLRAVLHDAVHHGPTVADRHGVGDGAFRAHLLGRISWVAAANPARGDRLRATFDRIAWPEPSSA